MCSMLSRDRLFQILRTVARQASLSMGFFRQEYRRGLPFPLSWGFSQIRNWTCISCNAGGVFTCESPGKPIIYHPDYQRCDLTHNLIAQGTLGKWERETEGRMVSANQLWKMTNFARSFLIGPSLFANQSLCWLIFSLYLLLFTPN